MVHVVAVHGVGAPEAGSLLPGLMRACSETVQARLSSEPRKTPPPIQFAPETLVAGERTHTGVQLLSPRSGEAPIHIWDANWADIHRAPQGWLLSLPFFARLMVATFAYAGRASRVGLLLRAFVSAILIWLPILPILSLWAGVLEFRATLLLVAIVLGAAAGLVAYSLRNTDRIALRAGIVWAILAPLLAILELAMPGALAPDRATDFKQYVFAVLALTGPTLLMLFFIFGRGPRRFSEHLSRVGLMALALSLISGAMAAILWANLYAADTLAPDAVAVPEARLEASTPAQVAGDEAFVSREKFEAWMRAYGGVLPYRLAPVEAATSWATALVGTGLLICVLIWWIKTRQKPPGDSGNFLRACLDFATRAIVALFFVVSLFIAIDIADVLDWRAAEARFNALRNALVATLFWVKEGVITGDTRPEDADLMAIYSQSTLRMLPFVGLLLVGPVRIALDVMADILHYLHDPEKPRARLRALLTALEATGEPIVVVAHSQGSRIAVDTIFAPDRPVPNGTLATTGSPIVTLYGDFLGASDLPDNVEGWTWRNYWRRTDFIGGAIPEKKGGRQILNDFEIETNLEDHHIMYWIESRVVDEALSWAPTLPKDEPRAA